MKTQLPSADCRVTRCTRFSGAPMAILAVLLALPLAAAAQDMADPYAAMGGFDVARLSDSDASCEQLFAESDALETRIAAMPKAADPMEAALKMQEDMRASQQAMMRKQKARSLGSQLLGMVPGVGGLAASALLSPRASAGGEMQDTIERHMREQQAGLATMMEGARWQARKEHVTSLFLERNCRVSALDAEAVARARAALAAEAPPAPASAD